MAATWGLNLGLKNLKFLHLDEFDSYQCAMSLEEFKFNFTNSVTNFNHFILRLWILWQLVWFDQENSDLLRFHIDLEFVGYIFRWVTWNFKKSKKNLTILEEYHFCRGKTIDILYLKKRVILNLVLAIQDYL